MASSVFDGCVRSLALEDRAKLWISNSDFSDAFAFGRGRTGNVVITRGLIDRLSNDELKGVLLHELTHVKNGDHSIMTWASSLVRVYRFFLPVYLVLSFLIIAFDVILGNPLGDPVWVLVHNLTTVLMVFVIPTVLVYSLSRTREYVADFSAYSIARTYPTALIKSAVRFRPLASRSEKLSLLPGPNSRPIQRLFSTHPPVQDRIRKMYGGAASNFHNLDCVKIGVIVAISTILIVEAIPFSVIYIFALLSIPLFSLYTYFERMIYAIEILAPAVILYFTIPNVKETVHSKRNSVLRGLAMCVGLLPVLAYFILPEQGVTLGGPFPIPKRVWPAPPSTFPSLFFAASMYFLVLCLISMLEWVIVPTMKSSLSPLIARYSTKRS